MKKIVIISLTILPFLQAQVEFSDDFLQELKKERNTLSSPIAILTYFALNIWSSEDFQAFRQAEKYLKAAIATQDALRDEPEIHDDLFQAHTLLGLLYEQDLNEYDKAAEQYLQAFNHTNDTQEHKDVTYKNLWRIYSKTSPYWQQKAKKYVKKYELIQDDEKKAQQ